MLALLVLLKIGDKSVGLTPTDNRGITVHDNSTRTRFKVVRELADRRKHKTPV